MIVVERLFLRQEYPACLSFYFFFLNSQLLFQIPRSLKLFFSSKLFHLLFSSKSKIIFSKFQTYSFIPSYCLILDSRVRTHSQENSKYALSYQRFEKGNFTAECITEKSSNKSSSLSKTKTTGLV